MIFDFDIICRYVLLVILLVLFGCKNTATHQRTIDGSSSQVSYQQTTLRVPVDTMEAVYDGLRNKAIISKYYEVQGGAAVWMKKDRSVGLTDSMLSFILRSRYYGLPSQRYHLSELETLPYSSSTSARMRRELLLTDAFFLLAADLRHGFRRDEERTNQDSVGIHLLEQVAIHGNLRRQLELQEPTYTGYKDLKEGLRLALDSMRYHNADTIRLLESVRLATINIERWRMENVTFSDRYIFINIPSFMLKVVDHDSIVLSSRVIVGTPEKETPVLSSVVECFTVYPYWHVPRKISTEEFLPILVRDTTFLRRNNFDVLDRKGNVLRSDSIDWSKFNTNYFPVVLRQREGVENSLGVIKFVFDNPYAVYLHDTNAKRLFSNSSRAFSHGCIRMEKAVELAHYLVTGSAKSESKMITKCLKEKQQRWLDLKKPTPIYTRYFTCEFKDGVFYRYKDIYHKDQQLYDLIYPRPGMAHF